MYERASGARLFDISQDLEKLVNVFREGSLDLPVVIGLGRAFQDNLWNGSLPVNWRAEMANSALENKYYWERTRWQSFR